MKLINSLLVYQVYFHLEDFFIHHRTQHLDPVLLWIGKRKSVKKMHQLVEGDIGVCGIAVLDNFSCGISVILI